MASSKGTVQASLPEWMSPTWTTSWMLVSALMVWMNAGVASNSAFFGKAGFVVSQYGESPYTASVNMFGLPPSPLFGLPAEAEATAIDNTARTAPSAIHPLMRFPLRLMVCPPNARRYEANLEKWVASRRRTGYKLVSLKQTGEGLAALLARSERRRTVESLRRSLESRLDARQP